MKLLPYVSLSALFLMPVGCGMLMPQGGTAAAPTTSARVEIAPESKDMVRKSERDAYAKADEQADEEMNKYEAELLKALRQSLGKEPAFQGGPVPESASTNVKALRAGKIKLRIETVKDSEGRDVGGGNFVQLKDSFTDRAQVLGRKMAEQKASPAEVKELQAGAKHMVKLGDLRMQVQNVSMSALKTNSWVQTGGLMQLLRVAQIVRSHKTYEMELNADDYALIKRGLLRQRRSEYLAASSMGMLAAMQAVAEGGDPKALDIIAESTLKAFPLQLEVTDDEAKTYVRELDKSAGQVKGRYEQMMRAIHGDAKYESKYKAGIDAMFKQVEGASAAKSVNEIVADTNAGYKADLAKCARGEEISPGSMVSGPTCKAERKKAMAAQGGGLNVGTVAGAAGVTVPGVPGEVGDAMNTVSAARNGDVSGVLDGASKLFPGEGPIKSSLVGIAAISKGDSKGALKAALGLAPLAPGGAMVGEGLGLAAKLLGVI